MAQAPEQDLVGQTLGGFQLIQKLGAGGMGVVYLARELALEREVALKVLSPKLVSDPRFVERFKKEARSAARLNHPGIVPIYQFGTADDLHFFAMAHVQGIDLSKLIKMQGRIDVKPALDIIGQAADALAHAHQCGVIHRDIKPQNIMLDRDWRVHILDFGLAKLLDDQSHQTTTGVFLGTPAYASPEQCENLALDSRSDLYSLGVVLYEMLGGVRPFVGKSPVGLIRTILESRPTPLDRLRSELDPGVVWIVHTLIARNPKDRFANARAVRAAIDKLTKTSGASSRSAPAGPAAPIPPPRANIPPADEERRAGGQLTPMDPILAMDSLVAETRVEPTPFTPGKPAAPPDSPALPPATTPPTGPPDSIRSERCVTEVQLPFDSDPPPMTAEPPRRRRWLSRLSLGLGATAAVVAAVILGEQFWSGNLNPTAQKFAARLDWTQAPAADAVVREPAFETGWRVVNDVRVAGYRVLLNEDVLADRTGQPRIRVEPNREGRNTIEILPIDATGTVGEGLRRSFHFLPDRRYQPDKDWLAGKQGPVWFHYERNLEGYLPMNWTGNQWAGQFGGMITPISQQPGYFDAVRAWKAPMAGRVRIDSKLRKVQAGGDGIEASIAFAGAKNNAAVGADTKPPEPRQLWRKIVEADQTQPLVYETSLTVGADDVIYFQIDPRKNETRDAVEWNPEIRLSPDVPVAP